MKRLLRDIKSQIIWFVALVAIFALACGIYVGFRSTYSSAMASFDNAYQKLNTPNIIVTTGPIEDLSGEIKNISGVSAVSPAWVTDAYTLINNKMVRGEVIGIEAGERVSDYQILEGKDIIDVSEVVVEHHYADKHNLKLDQNITIYIQGKPTKFNVSGICFSPKHLVLFSEEGNIEEDYGVFFILRSNFGRKANTFYIRTSEESDIDQVTSNINSFFEKKGIDAVVIPRDKMFSYTAIREDTKSLNSLANLFSIILLAISAVILFVILSRLIEMKRREIGTLRAMGFSKWSIFSYWLSFSTIAAGLGIMLGVPSAFGILRFIVSYYTSVFGVPNQFVTYNLNFSLLGYWTAFTFVFTLFGSFLPSFRAASLSPAEAMRPSIGSKKGGKVMVSASTSPTKKLIVRDIFSHKVRSVGTILVIGLVLCLGLSMALCIGSFNEGIKQRYDKNERWDIRINFNQPQNSQVLSKLKSISGVEEVETYSDVKAKISYNDKDAFLWLNILEKDTKMHSFSLSEGKVISDGITISGDVSHKVGVSVGDKVKLFTPFGANKTKVSAILQEVGSSEGYILKHMTTFRGALLKIKNGEMNQVEKSLQNLPFIKSWTKKEELKQGWLHLTKEYLSFVYAMDMVTILLVLVTIGVFVFLSTREREWEFTVLKAMGYHNREILQNGLLELLPLSLVGVLLSLPLSMHLVTLFNSQFVAVMSVPPTVFILDIVVIRCLLVIGFSLLTAFILIRVVLKRNVAERLRGVFETM